MSYIPQRSQPDNDQHTSNLPSEQLLGGGGAGAMPRCSRIPSKGLMTKSGKTWPEPPPCTIGATASVPTTKMFLAVLGIGRRPLSFFKSTVDSAEMRRASSVCSGDVTLLALVLDAGFGLSIKPTAKNGHRIRTAESSTCHNVC